MQNEIVLEVDRSSLEVDGINTWDYPDFCDAFFSYGEWSDGTPMTDEELNQFSDDNAELLNEMVHNHLM